MEMRSNEVRDIFFELMPTELSDGIYIKCEERVELV